MKSIQLQQTMMAILFGLSTLPASAVDVAQNASNIALSGTTVAAEPQLAGAILEDDLIPFSFKGITGTYQQRVVRSSVDNTIDFYWRITNDKTSTDTLTQFHYLEKEVNDYGVTYNVGWRTDGTAGEVTPVKVTRFANSALAQGGARFDFFKSDNEILEGAGIKPGQSTPFFFIDTNKTNYEKTAQSQVSRVFIGSSEVSAAFKVTKEENANNNTPPTPTVFENQEIVFQDNQLAIPCVEVYDANGGKVRYQAKLNYIPTNDNTFTFELADAMFADTKAENCNASYKDGNLDLPLVDVVDGKGAKFKYQASMTLAPSVGKLRFQLRGANADQSLDDGYNIELGLFHRLENVRNRKDVEVEDGLIFKGKRVQQYFGYSRNGSSDGHNQEWLFLPGDVVPGPNGTKKHLVRILNRGFMNYLTVNNLGQVELLPINPSGPNLGTLWEVVPVVPSVSTIRLRSQLTGGFLQVPADDNDGSALILAENNNSAAQQFVNIRFAYPFVERQLKNTNITLHPAHNANFALDVTACSTAENTPLVVWSKGTNNSCQQFVLKEKFLNVYAIQPIIASDLRVHLLDPGSRLAGSNVVIGSAAQPDNLWFIYNVVREPGKFIVVNGRSGLAMSVANTSSTPGANVDQNLFMNNENQKWTLQAIN